MKTPRPIQRRAVVALALIAGFLAMLAGTTVHAGKRGGHRRCQRDKQCAGGECNTAHQCCAPLTEEACGTTCCNSLVAACCGGACVDTTSDTANCGACGHICSTGQTCENGDCTCKPGFTDCGGDVCIDTSFNDANCGACGHACPTGQQCIASACGCAEHGKIPCNGTCIDENDPHNCGQCGHVCADGQSCVAGQCQSPCGLCEDLVDGACVPKDCGVNRFCAPEDGFCYVPCGGSGGRSSQCCDWHGIPHGCLPTDICSGGGCCNWQFFACESTDGTPYASCCDYNDICVQTESGRASCCKPHSRLPKECLRKDGWALPDDCCDFTYPKDYPGAWE